MLRVISRNRNSRNVITRFIKNRNYSSSSSSSNSSKETKNKFVTKRNGGIALGVVGIGVGAFSYMYTTDRKFKKMANENLPESVVSWIRGPIVRPSPFSVPKEKLNGLSRATIERIGQLFLTLDLHNENGFTKIQLILLIDKLGYDVVQNEAVSRMWNNTLILSEEEEEEEEQKRIIPQNEIIITAFELHRDVDNAKEFTTRAQEEYTKAQKEANDSWWLLGLGSWNEKDAIARGKASILDEAKLREEELTKRLNHLKVSNSYRGDDVVSMDEFLVLISVLSSGESEESTMNRFSDVIETIEKSVQQVKNEVTPMVPLLEQARQQQQPTPSIPQQQILEEVEVSDRAVIEHELKTVLEKRRKFLRDIGEKPKSEWSVSETQQLSRFDALESELREELNMG